MNELNETYHIPDPNNIESLVNSIYNGILTNGLQKAYLTLSNSDDNTFLLTDIYNPCNWLGDDCKIRYTIKLGYNKTTINSGLFADDFSFIDKSMEYNDVGVLHGGLFYFNICVGNGIVGFVMDHVKNDLETKLKARIQHELLHAYKDLFANMIFKPKDNPIKLSKVDVFYDGYKKITTAIKNNNFEDDNERKFLNLLYHINNIEVEANINGFYRKLRCDVINFKKEREIDVYYEYYIYYDYLKNIDQIISQKYIDKYKNEILNIFGKSCLSENGFKKKIKTLLEHVIHKMKDMYAVVGKYGIIMDDSDIEKLKESFNYNLYNSYELNEMDEIDKTILLDQFNKYSNNEQIMLINLFESLIEKIR